MSHEICEALSRHGTFLKKAVYSAQNEHGDIYNVIEEMPVSYVAPSSIDVFATIKENNVSHESLLFECKKAYVDEKKWVFIEAEYTCYRLCREISARGIGSKWQCKNIVPNPTKAVSDGFELRTQARRQGSETQADPNVLHKAGDQISAQYCGYLMANIPRIQSYANQGNSQYVQTVVPCIVTNAELSVAKIQGDNIDMRTASVNTAETFEAVPWVVFQHPFASASEQPDKEFRKVGARIGDDSHHEYAVQREDIYVINSRELNSFIDTKPWRSSRPPQA